MQVRKQVDVQHGCTEYIEYNVKYSLERKLTKVMGVLKNAVLELSWLSCASAPLSLEFHWFFLPSSATRRLQQIKTVMKTKRKNPTWLIGSYKHWYVGHNLGSAGNQRSNPRLLWILRSFHFPFWCQGWWDCHSSWPLPHGSWRGAPFCHSHLIWNIEPMISHQCGKVK